MDRAVEYVFRRLLVLVIGLLVIITAEFMILRVMPGDPGLLAMPRHPAFDYFAPEYQEFFDQFEEPLYAQFIIFAGDMLTGDFSYSFYRGTDTEISGFIYDYVGRTLILFISSVAISLLAGVFWGRFVARRRSHPVRQALSSVPLGLLSVTVLAWTWVLMKVLAAELRWFPATGVLPYGFSSEDPVEIFWAYFEHSVLPVTCLILSIVGFFALISRDGHAVMSGPSQGLAPKRPRTAEALFASLPNMQLLVAGSICFVMVTEVFFDYPGLGWLMVQSVWVADYPVIQAAFFLMAVVVLLSNFILDLVVTLIRPGRKLDDPVDPWEHAPAHAAPYAEPGAGPPPPAEDAGLAAMVAIVVKDYLKSPVGLVSLIVFMGLVVIAIVGPHVVSEEISAPYIRTPSYLFLTGATFPVAVGVIAGLVALVAGTLVGLLVGIARPYLDALLAAVTQGMIALPAVALIVLCTFAGRAAFPYEAGHYSLALRLGALLAAPVAVLVCHGYAVHRRRAQAGAGLPAGRPFERRAFMGSAKAVLPWALMGLKYGTVMAMMTVFICDFLGASAWESWGYGVRLACNFGMMATGGWDYVLPMFTGMFLLVSSTYLGLDTLERVVRARLGRYARTPELAHEPPPGDDGAGTEG